MRGRMIRAAVKGAGIGLAGIFAVALATASLPSAHASDDVDHMVDSFDEIVFNAEFGQTIAPRVTKWVDPLLIYLDIRAGDPTLYHRLVTAHTHELSRLTGLPIEIVASPDDANVFMVFDRDDALVRSAATYQPTIGRHSEQIAKTLCFGIYSVNRRSEIKRAVIGIPTDRAASLGKLSACVIEEMTQVMGLPNDSEAVSPSIFNDKSVDDQLTDLDRWMVRMLYDPSVEPGMDRGATLAQIRTLAADPLIAQRPLIPGSESASAGSGGAGGGGDLSQDAGDGPNSDLGLESDRSMGSGGMAKEGS